MRRVRERLTFANVISVVALFVALGGSAWAISANSVGSKQIKKGAVKKADLAANAVDSKKVADGSLLAGDFAAGQLPAGQQGPQGVQGVAGATGPQGLQGVPGQPGAPAPGQASPVTLNGVDFNTRDQVTRLADFGGGAVTWGTGAGFATARVDLPDAAKITKVEFYVVDNGAGQFTVALSDYIPSLGISGDIASANSTGASAGLQTVTVTPPSPAAISSGHGYEMRASSDTTGTTFVLYGARLYFTLP